MAITVQAQYAPQVGIAGSDAVAKTSTAIRSWATNCRIQRGLQQIDSVAAGYAQSGDSSLATGMADGTVVSLGDSGVATLTFNRPIVNGPGADFAVFENGFINSANLEEAFLELAFVEVSSDGAHFFRFPATSLTPFTTQLSSVIGQNYMNARLLNNLAGKYISGYGTPFDLQELAGTMGLDINNITHVRVIDVIGAVNDHASYDAAGHKINDPFPTAFPTGGFDLDAVAVINQAMGTGIPQANPLQVSIYPNPASDLLFVETPSIATLQLSDASGRILLAQSTTPHRTQLSLGALSAGIYYLTVQDENGNRWAGKVFRQ